MKVVAAIFFLLAFARESQAQTVPPPFPAPADSPDFWVKRADMLTLTKPLQKWVTANAPVDCNWYMMSVDTNRNDKAITILLWHSNAAPVVGAKWTSADGKVAGTIKSTCGPWPLQNGTQTSFLFPAQGRPETQGFTPWSPTDQNGWYGSTVEYYWCRNP